ncbi:MAG: 2'-5' RNA ligase family protein [Cyanobacteria bacterium J06638_22]
MNNIHRQLSLFVPEPERSQLDTIRQKYDPKQHAIIPAHVTLCRDEELEPWTALEKRLAALESVEITFALGAPKQIEAGGVLVPMANSSTAFYALRHQLLGDRCARQIPHITLLHPRHAAGKEHAYEAMCREPLPASVTLTEISLIEQINGGTWNALSRYLSGS